MDPHDQDREVANFEGDAEAALVSENAHEAALDSIALDGCVTRLYSSRKGRSGSARRCSRSWR